MSSPSLNLLRVEPKLSWSCSVCFRRHVWYTHSLWFHLQGKGFQKLENHRHHPPWMHLVSYLRSPSVERAQASSTCHRSKPSLPVFPMFSLPLSFSSSSSPPLPHTHPTTTNRNKQTKKIHMGLERRSVVYFHPPNFYISITEVQAWKIIIEKMIQWY